MLEPIRDENGNIIGMSNPDFLSGIPDVMYRLVKYQCTECDAEFLMDLRYVKESSIADALRCLMCESETEAVAATKSEDSDMLRDLGCAYPNGMTIEQEWMWRK